MTEAHWLVPGMELQVTLDPNRPERFEINWESVPGMENRAASGDPALADPIAARRKVAHALGLTQADTGAARTERFERALEQVQGARGTTFRTRRCTSMAGLTARVETYGWCDGAALRVEHTGGAAAAELLGPALADLADDFGELLFLCTAAHRRTRRSARGVRVRGP